jgi:hypothetical protein
MNSICLKPIASLTVHTTFCWGWVGSVEGLNYKRPVPICRLIFKIDLLTDIAALCLTDFICRLEIHSLIWFVFLTQLVNCCPHGRRNYTCVLLPLYLLSDSPPPPSPLPKLNVQFTPQVGSSPMEEDGATVHM